MKKHIAYFFLIVLFPVLFSSCPFGGCQAWRIIFEEVRHGPINTNIIGIVGPPETEVYVEITFSEADETSPGHNKTVSKTVRLPYVFQQRVYMTYRYREHEDNLGTVSFVKTLLRDFTEGGAEYFRIVNNSEFDVEFFLVDANTDMIGT
ncbi:MAG: hypothetical protein LBG93_03970 [Treponema sp.]|jgi:hypothetical protein|nr:hypothetical protein [Treponema sp.]